MARGDQKRSVRRDPSLREGQRDVVLQESRRFFTARGNDQAERGARALTNALGIGVDAYAGVLERRNVEGTARAAQQAATGGERDPDDPNKGYNDAFDQVEASNDLAIFAKDLPEMLDKEGWSDLPEEEAQARIDDYYSKQLAGINPDSLYGILVADGILKQNAALLDVHRTVQIEKGQQERRIMVLNEARADFENDGVIDHEKLMDRLHILVPGPGGRLTYIESVIDLAEEFGAPELIESIPEFFPSGDPTGTTDPKFKNDVIDPGLAKAHSVRTANIKAAEERHNNDFQTDRAAAHSNLTTRAKAGDASVIHDIVNGGFDGPPTVQMPNGSPRLLSRAQQKTLFDQLTNSQIAGAVDANAGDLFGEGRAFGMTVTEYDNAAANFASRLNDRYANENPDWDDERREAEVLKVVLERSYRHDRLPKHITDFLNVTPSSPERFQEAVNVKRMIDTYDKTLVQRSISDRNAAFMDVYELVLKDTGSEEAAMEVLNQYDQTLSNGRGDEITKIAEAALEELAGDSGFLPGDFEITTRDRQRAAELTKHYMNLGYSDDRAETFVVNGMRGRNTRVGGVLYPMDAGWRTGDEAADWYLGSVANDFFVDVEHMVMKPHPSKKGFVVIQDSNAMMPYASPEVAISEIENGYQRRQDEQLVALAEGSKAPVSDKLNEAEKRAFFKTFPRNDLAFLEPGERVDAMRRNREAWDDMSPADRQRLIQAEMKQN